MLQMDTIEILRRQYLQMLDPAELAIPCKKILKSPETQTRLYNDMFNESEFTHLPPYRYRFQVLKRLMNKLEAAIEDPDEDVGFPSRVTVHGQVTCHYPTVK